MGKIKERRERTANANVENKAVLAEAPAKVKEFPYKKILIAVLAVVAVIACALLIINAVVDSKASKLANGPAIDTAAATVEVKGDLYENAVDIIKMHSPFAEAYYNASMNYNKYAGNAKANENVYNFVVTINDETYAQDSANVVASMILSFNKAENKVTYVMVNKGALVEIPTVGVGPLYDAYKFGGTALYARTVQENFGIAINGYVDMTLASFVESSTELGGITIDDTKYSTEEEIYNYVKNAEDRDVATKSVITTLAAGAKDAGVVGLAGLIDTLADTMTANISRSDVGDLIGMGAGIFKAEAIVLDLGYETSKPFSYVHYVYVAHPDFFSTVYFDYATEIPALQTALYGE